MQFITAIQLIAAGVAIIVSLAVSWEIRRSSVPANEQARYARDVAQSERDNLVATIRVDHDRQAKAMNEQRALYTVRRPDAAASLPAHAGETSGGVALPRPIAGLRTANVEVYGDNDRARIAVSKRTVGDAQTETTTFYLAEGGTPFLIVRAYSGARNPSEERWYFEGDDYVTFGDNYRFEDGRTTRISYSPDTDADIAALREELRVTLVRTNLEPPAEPSS